MILHYADCEFSVVSKIVGQTSFDLGELFNAGNSSMLSMLIDDILLPISIKGTKWFGSQVLLNPKLELVHLITMASLDFNETD